MNKEYIDKIMNIKKQFKEKFAQHSLTSHDANNFITKMREEHGKLIYQDMLDKNKMVLNAQNINYLQLSANASLINAMQDLINKFEITRYQLMKTSNENKYIKINQRDNVSENIEEISLEMDSPIISKQNINSDFTVELQKNNKNPQSRNDTSKESIKEPISYEESMAGGATPDDENKPTLVNVYADWCPASKSFLTTWTEFKKTNSANIQLAEINVGRDMELNKMVQKIGVDAYPKLVLFHNGKIDTIFPSKLNSNEILRFVQSAMEANKV